MTQSKIHLNERTVGEYTTPEAAEAAIARLKKTLAPDDIFSVFERGDMTPEVEKSQIGRSAKGGAIAGGFLGSMTGFFGSFIAVSFMDSLVAGTADARLYMLVLTVAGGIFGAAGFGAIGAVAGVNTPKASAPSSPNDVEIGRYLVKVRGTEDEIAKATEILMGT
jgi:hypothetical protein